MMCKVSDAFPATAAPDLQGIDVDGMKQQLTAALGRIKTSGGSQCSITEVEQDVEYAEQLMRLCVTKPTSIQAALKAVRAALGTAKVLLMSR
jgi:hypothetical protein